MPQRPPSVSTKLTVFRLLSALFLMLSCGHALATEAALTAKQILQKMVSAMAVANYQGTVVFLKNDKLEAMKYSHSNEQNKEQERLVSLNSPQREIVRNFDEVTCFYKLTRQVIIDKKPYEHSFIVDVPRNLDDLESTYDFQLSGEEDVAMMPSYVVAIQPKDDFRYTRKIWVTKKEFLPMKAVVYNLSGAILEQVVFTEVQLNPSPSASKTPIFPAPEARTEPTAKPLATTESSGEVSFDTSNMPQGFKQIFFSRKPIPQSEEPVDHLLVSDGFASVSVYLESKKKIATPELPMPEGIHSVGAVNSITRTLGDSQLTVLGEVPAETIKFIADGVKLRQSAP